MINLDEKRLLGCAYIDPPTKRGYDAEVYYWIRTDEIESGLEDILKDTLQSWIKSSWPFQRVAYPGRKISWREWEELDDVTESG